MATASEPVASSYAAVIMAVPAVFPISRPLEVTVATAGLLDVQEAVLVMSLTPLRQRRVDRLQLRGCTRGQPRIGGCDLHRSSGGMTSSASGQGQAPRQKEEQKTVQWTECGCAQVMRGTSSTAVIGAGFRKL